MKRAYLLILIASALLLGTESRSPIPSPRDSIQATGQGSGDAEKKPQTDRSPAAQPSTVAITTPAPDKEAAHLEIADQHNDTAKPIRVAPVDLNRDFIDYINPVLTLLLVLVGAAYAILASGQLRAIGRQAQIAEKTLTLQFRPRLIVRNVVVTPISGGGGTTSSLFLGNYPVTGQFYVANVGGSDAHITEVGCWVEWFQVGLPMRRPYETKDGNTAPYVADLKPGQSTPCIFDSVTGGGRAMDPALAVSITQGANEWRLYVMGWVEYADDLKIKRRTVFCRIWDFGYKRFRTVDDPDYEYAE